MIQGGARKLIVSIHVPLAEHDLWHMAHREADARFNSRAPRGARPLSSYVLLLSASFQFTCPSRSTTDRVLKSLHSLRFQFTCPSRSTTASIAYTAGSLAFQFTCPSRSTTS